MHPLQDASAVAALRDIFPLPARSLVSTRQSSESVDPATPADHAVADWPTALTQTIPVAFVHCPAIVASCSARRRTQTEAGRRACCTRSTAAPATERYPWPASSSMRLGTSMARPLAAL